MAKIILIDPQGWQGAVNKQIAYPNIGIAYLASALRKNGHNPSIIDLNNESLDYRQVLKIIEAEAADIVGFSVKTATIKNAESLAVEIKKKWPKLPLMVGGPHATLCWQELMQKNIFDIVFVGEGEQIIPTVCQYLMEQKPIEDLPGVITRKNFQNKLNLIPPLIENLDELAFPDYSFFPKNIQEFIRSAYPLLTSRGCVYNCIYCSVPLISGRIFRKRSPQNVIEELKWAIDKYNIKGFEIIDDNFNFDVSRTKEICRLLIQNNFKFKWSCPNGVRADRVDKELADLMFKSGCYSVNVGIESADPEVFTNIKKGETLNQIKEGVEIFKQAGLLVTGFFIIGLPNDSIESQKKSIDFAHQLGIDAFFSMLVPYPKTEVWNWAHKNNFFIGDPQDALHFADSKDKVNIIFETKDFPKEDKVLVYEMVNTKFGRFGVLIPKNTPFMEYLKQACLLTWKYNRLNFRDQYFLFKNIINKLRRKLKVHF